MFKKIAWFYLLFTFVLLWACAPKSLQEKPEVKKLMEPTPVSAVKASWEVEWAKILKEARREGTVVIYGPPYAEVRQRFTEEFQKAYPGIMMDYTGMRGVEKAPKIRAERRAGIYLADIFIGGTTTALSSLKEFAVPIKPLLILPEVTDTKSWLEGKLDFSDEAEQLNLVFVLNADPNIAYNTGLASPGEINSWWDLIKPKWKEKIIMRDPRTAGAGLALVTFLYLHKELGLDYIKALAENKPLLTRDGRLQAEWVGRGKYIIAVGPNAADLYPIMKAGLPVKWTELMKEGTFASAVEGSIMIMDKAPHPNATIVFLNWLLGREGQTVWTTASGLASRRLDAPMEHIPEAERVKPGVFYLPVYKEQFVLKREEVLSHVEKIFSGF